MAVPPQGADRPSVIGGALPWAVPAAVAIGGAIWSAESAKREAEKNRKFQAEMSSTAHQREVKDLVAAGLNPMLSAHGSGSSTPSGALAQLPDMGEAGSRAIASALAVKQAQANIVLTRAQAYNTVVSAEKLKMESQSLGAGGQVFEQRGLDIELSRLNIGERRNLFGPAVARAYADLDNITSATRAARARAALDEFAARGAMNARDVEELISKMPEWTRLFGPILRGLAGPAAAAGGFYLGAKRIPSKVGAKPWSSADERMVR